MDFDAVIFDCDGVLVDSEAIHVAVEMELLAELAAGMTTIGYSGGGHADDRLGERLTRAGATDVFDSHREILAHLFT
ncbi:MAG: hypothetical protein O3A21_05000 [Proteobacteria bacterium]|nr:hypothetical protein [Pseudomonadota bacterium]